MRVQVNNCNVKLWVSANETYEWAHRVGKSWPCSQLSGKRLFAEFDGSGLLDIAINGRMTDCDANEFNALTSDMLRDSGKVPTDHPAYYVNIGQFQG